MNGPAELLLEIQSNRIAGTPVNGAAAAFALAVQAAARLAA